MSTTLPHKKRVVGEIFGPGLKIGTCPLVFPSFSTLDYYLDILRLQALSYVNYSREHSSAILVMSLQALSCVNYSPNHKRTAKSDNC
jgi:hypothetical protein